MPHQTIHSSRAIHPRMAHKVTVPRRSAWGCREPFSYEAEANSTTLDGQKVMAVWTDGLSISNEESSEDRKKGFRPAYRSKKGRRYRITIEELPN